MSSHQIELFYWDKLWMSTGIFSMVTISQLTQPKGTFWKIEPGAFYTYIEGILKMQLNLINPFTPKTSSITLRTVCHIILDVGWKNLIFDQLKIPKLMFLYFYHLSAGYCNDIVTRISVSVTYGHLRSFHSST